MPRPEGEQADVCAHVEDGSRLLLQLSHAVVVIQNHVDEVALQHGLRRERQRDRVPAQANPAGH